MKPQPTTMDRLVEEERGKVAAAMARIRVGLAILLIVSSWAASPSTLSLEVLRSTSIAWLIIATLWLVLFKNEEHRKRLASWPGLVDIVVFGLSHSLQLSFLSSESTATQGVSFFDLYSVANGTIIALLTFTVFSYSRPALLLGALLAGTFMVVYANVGPTAPVWAFQGIALLVPFGLAWALATFTSRFERLVREARKRELLGKYVLGERIGFGGMAEVFAATYCPEGGFVRKVALKRILPNYAQDTEAVSLFRREAEIGAMLAHPNIVQIYDFGAIDKTYFLAMEYVDGITLWQLFDYLRRQKRHFPIPVLTYIAWCLADALAIIHHGAPGASTSMKLIHRDVNPPNVLLSNTGEVKLSDFGIARAAGVAPETAAGRIRGKLSYAAPEQVRGETIDERVDLYGLGVTLWEAATLHRMIAARSDAEVLQCIVSGKIESPDFLRGDLPKALSTIIMELVERDNHRRLPNARALTQRIAALGTPWFDLHIGRSELQRLVTEAQASTEPVGDSPVENSKTLKVWLSPQKVA